MLNMNDLDESEDPHSLEGLKMKKAGHQDTSRTTNDSIQDHPQKGIINYLKSVFKIKTEHTLREALEEYIEEVEENGETTSSIEVHERLLLSNILKVRDLTVVDVMIPRADIASIDIETSQKDLLALLAERQFSRFPVFRDSLDNVIGTIHIKDIIAHLASSKRIEIEDLVREVPIVSPAMHVLDLLLMMRKMKKHLALVVDEFGGIDGLVTIGDVIEAIVGEVDDEYEHEEKAEMKDIGDGSVVADGRVDIEEFEEKYGEVVSEDEREDIDTLGGLVSAIAGRVPARGEVLSHTSGITFEIIDADPRRVNRLRIRNIPKSDEDQ
jgi:CBS domain containing-hemolysin-like protein